MGIVRGYGWLLVGILLTCFCSIRIQAEESLPNYFNLEGLLTDTGGVPIEDNSVDFSIRILNPLEDCVLYEETQNLDLSGTGGSFNLFVGSKTTGTKRTANDLGITMVEVFNNSTSKGPGSSCASPYSPVLGDQRQIEIEVNSVSLGTETLPSFSMGSVPSAMVATTLQGLLPSELIQTSVNVTQTNIESLTNGSDVTLHNHNTANDGRYLAIGGAGSKNLGSGQVNATGNVGIGFGGAPSANLEVQSTNPSIHVDDSSGLGSASIDFQSSGTSKGSIDVNSLGTMMFLTNGTPALSVDSGQNVSMNQGLNVTNGVSAGTVQVMGNGPLKLYDADDSDYVALQSPSSVTAYSLTLPIDAGGSGDFLMTDGAGNLFWSTAGGAPIATVFGRTGAVVGATSDYDAVQVDNAPGGNIAATNVQAAIDELDTEKFSNSGGTISGATTMSSTLSVLGGANFSSTMNVDSTLTTTSATGIKFNDTDNSNFMFLKPAGVIGADFTLTFPDNDGASGDVLTTDGTGTLSWTAPAGGGVSTVFGRGGAVTAVAGDYTASQVASAAVGNVASTDVQGAIGELEAEKLALSGGTMTGVLNMGSQNISGVNSVLAVSYTGSGTLTNGGDANFDTGTLFVDSSSDRVGVGTISPATVFHTFTNGSDNMIFGGVGQVSDEAGIQFGTAADVWRVSHTPNQNYLNFSQGSSTSPSTKMVLSNAGNLGVGTTSPTEKLDVSGNTVVSGNSTVNGRVGIGGSPDGSIPLRVVASSTNVISAESTGTTSGIQMKSGSGGSNNRIYSNDSNNMYFQTNSGFKMKFFDSIDEIQMDGDVDMQSTYTIKNLPNPTGPTEAVNKQTLDDVTQVIAARYKRTSTQTLTSGVQNRLDFNVSEFDIGGNVTTGGSWKFTVPAGGAGIYQVSASMTLITGRRGRLRLHYDSTGSTITVIDHDWANAKYERQGTTIVQLYDGDIMYVTFEPSGGSDQLDVTDPINWITIHRVGKL